IQSNDDWENFDMERRVIKAPKNRRIRVTIGPQTSMTMQKDGGGWPRCPSQTCDSFAVETADGDLAFTGKKFCCNNDAQKSFVSKNTIWSINHNCS
ncbi:hypothetical protein PENTCL1PPCAC_10536, partial [Pristionchus entomophagus]